MRLFTFLFYILWMFLFNIITYTTAFLVLILSYILPDSMSPFIRWCVSIWSRVGFALALSPVEVRGRENLIDEAGLIICNHQSSLDILACSGFFPKDFLFFSKKEVFNLPFIGQLMKKMGYISVDRKKPKKAAASVLQALQKIKNQNNIIIFPEGSRNKNPKEMLPLKPGAILMARQGKVPILPVIIYGTKQILPDILGFYMKPTKVIMQILPAILPENPMHPIHCKSIAEEDLMLENLRGKLSEVYNKLANEMEQK